jgi:hypothetical protein
MRLLNDAKIAGHIPAIVHSHPKGNARFSEQDDRNEAELARTALLKGMPGLISIIIAGDGDIAARIWTQTDKQSTFAGSCIPDPACVFRVSRGTPADFLDRQVRLFGEEASRQVSRLSVWSCWRGCNRECTPAPLVEAWGSEGRPIRQGHRGRDQSQPPPWCTALRCRCEDAEDGYSHANCRGIRPRHDAGDHGCLGWTSGNMGRAQSLRRDLLLHG